jgi:hypothetical protein
MILCVQNIFPEGSISLFDAKKSLVGKHTWKTDNKGFDMIAEISKLLVRHELRPSDVTKIFAVKGPGPFTAVRILAVIIEVWRSQMPQVEVFSVPTGTFLFHKFPSADSLFLSAGKTAFFEFDMRDTKNFKKLPFEGISLYQGTYGGFFHSSCVIPKTIQAAPSVDDAAVFRDFFDDSSRFSERRFQPVYGSEPSIHA